MHLQLQRRICCGQFLTITPRLNQDLALPHFLRASFFTASLTSTHSRINCSQTSQPFYTFSISFVFELVCIFLTCRYTSVFLVRLYEAFFHHNRLHVNPISRYCATQEKD